MKTIQIKFKTLFFALLVGLIFTGCSKDDEQNTTSNLDQIQGIWTRVGGNHPANNGMVIKLENNSGVVIDKAASNSSEIAIGDIKWKDIVANGNMKYRYQELGSDRNYYPASMELGVDDTLRISVDAQPGVGFIQKWVQNPSPSVEPILLNCNSFQSNDPDAILLLENNNDGVDYIIDCVIAVEVDLKIQPGVVIEFASNAGMDIKESGSLSAVGSANSPIVFRGKTATPGFWSVLHFDSNNPNNELNYVSIADGGGSNSYNNASIWVNDNNSGQLTFKNSTIKNSKGYGLLVEGNASIPNFSNNTFSNNGDAPLDISMLNIGSLDAASNYGDGNTKNYVSVNSSNVNQPQVIKSINVPYLIKGNSNIKDNLTLNPGVQFLMASGASIDVNSSGSIHAIGTSSDPISIKGEVDAVGYWGVIHVDSNNPLNEFAFVNIKNGGSLGSFDYSSIWVNDNNNGAFIMNDCSISDSYSWGLFVENGASMTPSTKNGVESTNTFINNGSGTNANCTDGCTVYFE
jgi:hypothetical protein